MYMYIIDKLDFYHFLDATSHFAQTFRILQFVSIHFLSVHLKFNSIPTKKRWATYRIWADNWNPRRAVSAAVKHLKLKEVLPNGNFLSKMTWEHQNQKNMLRISNIEEEHRRDVLRGIMEDNLVMLLHLLLRRLKLRSGIIFIRKHTNHRFKTKRIHVG